MNVKYNYDLSEELNTIVVGYMKFFKKILFSLHHD